MPLRKARAAPAGCASGHDAPARSGPPCSLSIPRSEAESHSGNAAAGGAPRRLDIPPRLRRRPDAGRDRTMGRQGGQPVSSPKVQRRARIDSASLLTMRMPITDEHVQQRTLDLMRSILATLLTFYSAGCVSAAAYSENAHSWCYRGRYTGPLEEISRASFRSIKPTRMMEAVEMLRELTVIKLTPRQVDRLVVDAPKSRYSRHYLVRASVFVPLKGASIEQMAQLSQKTAYVLWYGNGHAVVLVAQPSDKKGARPQNVALVLGTDVDIF